MNTIEQALQDLKDGKMIIVVDDKNRENEGDLVIAAEKVTPEAINFMASHGRGLICLALTKARIAHLELEPLTKYNTSKFHTNFNIPIEAKEGVTTGISVYDRAKTILTAIDPKTTADDLTRPGHVATLTAQTGGVLKRPGHTEAAVDLAALAGLNHSGVICEIMATDGTMATGDNLTKFAIDYGLSIITIADLIIYRKAENNITTENYKMTHSLKTVLPTKYGDFDLYLYRDILNNQEHLALTLGDVTNTTKSVPVRIHSACLTGDVFGSKRCDCGSQIDQAMAMIGKNGSGILVYLDQEGRGIGLSAKLQAYVLQDQGLDTVEANQKLGFEADERDFSAGCQILNDLGVERVTLMTNNPQKVEAVEQSGIKVVRQSHWTNKDSANENYLNTKLEKMGHLS
ncbi:MAG: bifunctional 3,4-dihydroxy-2-butanone-4-phosphate synthase/GTP cyclohydrolase II [Parcubacteria group bacterium]|jgi:3,4-dihydroxy 2-butanone 4-phosphate synthase/GTP cyclohydrolase II|nr:bifunctional 3,4-dihydroxy-2-butanone-4-phosphate synthase/GTP cyclohydrolase II [Parcubacteria group bacterium]|tara:strand:+ start:2581 stop:3786 length:1206 start_codon:yes stop_codon:yes gene_type:complete